MDNPFVITGCIGAIWVMLFISGYVWHSWHSLFPLPQEDEEEDGGDKTNTTRK